MQIHIFHSTLRKVKGTFKQKRAIKALILKAKNSVILSLLLWVWFSVLYDFALFPSVYQPSPHAIAVLYCRTQTMWLLLFLYQQHSCCKPKQWTEFNWLVLDFHGRPPGAHQLCSWWQPFVPLILSVGCWPSMCDIGTALTVLIYTPVFLDLLQLKGKGIMTPWMSMGRDI